MGVLEEEDVKVEVALEAVTKQPSKVLLQDIHEILQTEVNFMVSSPNTALEGAATKGGLRNPPIKRMYIGLSCGADQCGFN